MADVAAVAGAVRAGAADISRACDDLLSRSERHASNLEESASVLDQITSGVRDSVKGLHTARNATREGEADAAAGGEVVQQAVAAMERISRSSGQIGQIVGVIDEIAFQTSLLALNAGVEAARAGDAGRGFAIVAQEVRALAQRSAEAAREIKTIIAGAGEVVSQGVILVGRTGESLTAVGARLIEINSLMEQVSGIASQQSNGLTQVNQAIGEMNAMSHQNAAGVEELVSASRGLAAESERLSGLLQRLTLAGKAPAQFAA